MNAGPAFVVLAVFHDSQIKRPQGLADMTKMAPIAAVAADIDAPPRRNEGKTGPLGLIALEQAAGKMLARQDVHRQVGGQGNRRIPIFLVDVSQVEAPLLEILADTQGQTMSFTLSFKAMTLG